MTNILKRNLLFTLILIPVLGFTQAGQTIYFTAVKGEALRTDTVRISPRKSRNPNAVITGPQKDLFVVSSTFEKKDGITRQIYILTFKPDSSFLGIARATLKIDTNVPEIMLRGLSMPGLEGHNEPPLAEVFEIMDIGTEPGWKTLANHIKPDLQGDEIGNTLFQKAGEGPVEIVPIARFSPPYSLPFGFYLNVPEGPELHQVGILANSRKYHEHQTLMPSLESGQTEFDPGTELFGLYVVSPTHNSFTDEIWNHVKFPDHTAHAARIYPLKDKNGKAVANEYLVCLEEASNGDYNDYVFHIKNVRPVPAESLFRTLLNPDDLNGWKIFLQTKGINNDPENIFTISGGELHDMGKELGYILTDESFTNYHFRLQFKWGEKKWPPREEAKRDSGICYHIPEFEENQIWPQSIECQIQEGDVGDFWLLSYSTIEVDGVQNVPYRHSRMQKNKDGELPNGEWNTVEVITFNGTCVHIVNGIVVNYGTNSSLRKGRILLQSEYAEIYYRNVEIRTF